MAKAENRGVTANVGLGVNTCIGNGDFDCEELNSGGGLNLELGYRFKRLFGLSLDGAFGFLSHTSDDLTVTTLHIIPSFRMFFQLGPVTGTVGLGIGYSRFQKSMEDEKVEEATRATTVAAVKPSLAFRYPISDALLVGLVTTYVHNGEMTSCSEPDMTANCAAYDGPGLLQVGALLGYQF